jgi:hypothetical protein
VPRTCAEPTAAPALMSYLGHDSAARAVARPGAQYSVAARWALPGYLQMRLHQSQTGSTAQRLSLQAMCAAIPARHPLLPGRMRSLRCASVIPTSPPPQGDPRARSGSLHLHSAKSKGGNQSGIWVKELAVVMTEEGASKTAAHDCRKRLRWLLRAGTRSRAVHADLRSLLAGS